MLVLAVESATETAAVALIDDDGALGSFVLARGRRHTETIVPAIDDLCRRVGVALAELDVLAVDVGPGLFTGLRVGVGTVKALSFALDLPVVTASSLEVLAHAVAGAGADDGRLLVPVVDARRGEVFSARFRVTAATAAARPAAPGDRRRPRGCGPRPTWPPTSRPWPSPRPPGRRGPPLRRSPRFGPRGDPGRPGLRLAPGGGPGRAGPGPGPGRPRRRR